MRKLKVNRIALCGTALCWLLIAVTTLTDAQIPGPHPEYLHAIRDLREARDLMRPGGFTNPAHVQAAARALPEINAAIGELKSAAKLDEKSLGDVPPNNSQLPPVGRFHRAKDLLLSARHDAKGTESDPVAIPHRDRALQHIDAASAAIVPAL